MKASVIVPAYNAASTIKGCIESLQRQDAGFDYEIIVVDDGSSDATAEIAKEFKNVKLVKQKNSGPAAARNAGVKNAKGSIVVFTDSDCIVEKNWLKEIVQPFEDVAIAGVQGRYKTRQRALIARLIQLEIEQRYEKMQRQQNIDFIGSYAAAYRKDVFNEMHGFDTTFPIASGEDTDLSFRVSKAGHKMVFNPNAVVMHSHPESFWKYLKIKFQRAFWRTKVYGKHREKMLHDAYTAQEIKLQAVLLYAVFASAAAYAFSAFSIIYPAALFVLLFASTLPFSIWTARRDLQVAVVAPFAALLRTAAFDAGLLLGAINNLRVRR